MLLRTFYYLQQLKRNLYMKPAELQKMQLKKLRAIVKYAYERVPFYHRKFRAAGVKPDAIRELADLHKIPVTSKFEVQACRPSEIIASGFDLRSLVKRTTSGSTGVPLTLFFNDAVEDFYAAVWIRAMFQDGLRFFDKMAVIADPRSFPKEKSFFQRLGLAQRKYISIFDSAAQQMALLREFKPNVVKGYASSLQILADEFGDQTREVGSRLVFSGAELLDAVSRKRISSAFGGELFDFYGSSEFSLLAWECKAHNGYHINADSVLIEFLDDSGDAVAFGESGKAICTGLFNRIMPLIRYDLDDMAVSLDDECTCGVTLPLIKVVEGRTDDFLLTIDGRSISPTVFFPYPFDSVEWIKQFRVIQESRKRLVIQVAPKGPFDRERIVKYATRRIRDLFGEDMDVEIDFVEVILPDRSSKIRKIVSNINS